MNIAELFAQHEGERYVLNGRHLNDQMVRVLQAIGYDIGFCHGKGQYLYTRDGTRYLDLLSGYGVFAIGRTHPKLREALKSVLDADLPNLVQMDVSTLAGILAERLLTHVPYLGKALFVNSGSEAVEAAIKLARAATGRTGIVYCDHAFHGLSYGALSLNGDEIFRNGFEPLLPDCVRIPFNDLFALEKALHARTIAAFIVEPIQGKGVNMPADNYLKEAAAICRRPRSLKLKASWRSIEATRKGLFCQLITIPLFKEHKILSQVASHTSHTIKLLPALVISEADCQWIIQAFASVLAGSERLPGAILSLGKTLIGHAMRASA